MRLGHVQFGGSLPLRGRLLHELNGELQWTIPDQIPDLASGRGQQEMRVNGRGGPSVSTCCWLFPL